MDEERPRITEQRPVRGMTPDYRRDKERREALKRAKREEKRRRKAA